MKKQDFKVLKTKDLYPFPDNPFHVAEDETLSELAESIKEFGIVTPIITRPKEDGDGYEVIAGQRRVRASELAGINTVPAFVLPLDRDRAIITLVDSNLQRENILPSERAFAYKMKSEEATPSLSQAQRMKQLSQSGRLDMDTIFAIMTEEKGNQKETLKINTSKLKKYFPKNTTPKQMEETIIKLLERELQRKRNRDSR